MTRQATGVEISDFTAALKERWEFGVVGLLVLGSSYGLWKLYKDAIKQHESKSRGKRQNRAAAGKAKASNDYSFDSQSWDDVPMSRWNGGGNNNSSGKKEKESDDEDDEIYDKKTFDKNKDSSWERSKKLKEAGLGYYYAHHDTTGDGIASHEYEMEKPKLLRRTTLDPNASLSDSAGSARKVYMPKNRIVSYAWEDKADEVRLTFRQTGFPDGWDWSKVAAEDVQATADGRKVLLEILCREENGVDNGGGGDSSGVGGGGSSGELWWFEASNLYQGVDGATVKVLKSRCVLTLQKKDKGTWPRLLK